MSFEPKREIVEADPVTGTYRATYGYPSEPPSVAVPLALVEVIGGVVTDLDPLYEAASIDPDALDELFRPMTEKAEECCVTFDYHDHEVTVKSHGRIVIRESVR
ncbi:HalOD1 output domain-containing protein [Halorussus lipolyticus]|uniref:HalOD1 output domain-containing protein n=1 Tax=Halorussus lipolyticus TaxID=3034024 RepID=UPI0023E8E445|nr:HalOD1 output domain-containing protein [Halorussus sp. DT80]